MKVANAPAEKVKNKVPAAKTAQISKTEITNKVKEEKEKKSDRELKYLYPSDVLTKAQKKDFRTKTRKMFESKMKQLGKLQADPNALKKDVIELEREIKHLQKERLNPKAVVAAA